MRRALAKLLNRIAWHLVKWSSALQGYKAKEMVVSTHWKEMD